MIPVVDTSFSSLTPAPTGNQVKLEFAAKQFEAIFVRQMLAAARKTDFGESIFGGQAMDTFRQMQDERFAEIAAQTGAFGLASVLEAQLARHLPTEE